MLESQMHQMHAHAEQALNAAAQTGFQEASAVVEQVRARMDEEADAAHGERIREMLLEVQRAQQSTGK